MVLGFIFKLRGEVAGHSPADHLPIEKTLEAPVRCLPADIRLPSGVQSICDAATSSSLSENEVSDRHPIYR